MHERVCVQVYVRAGVSMRVRVCVCVYVHVRLHVRACACTCPCACLCAGPPLKLSNEFGLQAHEILWDEGDEALIKTQV